MTLKRSGLPPARYPVLALLLVLCILALLALAPWVTPTYAQWRAESAFTASWQGVADGCGFNCTGCGVTRSQKTWFGYRVEIEYACGLLPEDTAEYHKHINGFVSFLGTVHELPEP